MQASNNPVTQFYNAFRQLDYRTMQGCYHKDATFSDPVFQNLTCEETRMMWEMLCKNAKNFSLQFSILPPKKRGINCRWIASYTFSQTNRLVVNHVSTFITLQDGMIKTHHDSFSLWNWSRQALGTPGLLLGWTPYMKRKIRSIGRKSLDSFIAHK